jgi:hypothetical protein
MASSYTDIGTELMATGENAGTWGTKTNTNIQILEEAINGYVSQALTSSGTVALTYTDGSTGDVARHAVIALTGTITGNAVVTVPANEKVWIIDNQSSGAYTVTVKVSGQTGVTWGTSDKGTKILYANGTDVVDTNIGGGVGAQDLNGEEFILDADADTSITADTDDQIDIKIAGADDFQFTANTFTAQAGSTIAAQALTATTVTASGIVKTDDTTDASSTTDGSLQTDGGLSVAKDAVIGDDLKLLSDSAVLSFGADSDTTLTHTDGTGLTLNSTNKLTFQDTGTYIHSNADGDLDVVSDGTAVDSINLESAGGITLDAGTAGSGIIYEDDGTEMLRVHNSSSDVIIESKVSDKDIIFKVNDGGSSTEVARIDGDVSALLIASGKELRFADSGEKISGDGTDLTLNSGADINLTATTDINVPANVGITFGDDGEKIEGDGTDLTVSGNNINLTATADVNIPSGVGLTFATAEKIESDGTDLSITVGSNGDINIPANIGVTFGDDGEKIEGDGTDLTISGNNINLTATADVVIPANVGITFGTGEKIEGDSTDLTVTSGAKINLTATSDVHIPNNVGIVFGGDSEKIEGDGTDMTISANNLTVDAAADIILDAAGNNLTFKSGGTSILDVANNSSDVELTVSVADKNFKIKGTDGASAITPLDIDMADAGKATFSGAVVVGGDLTVNGTTTTVNSTTVTIDDPIFTLGGDTAPGSDDNKDRGIEFRYHDGSSARIGFFGFDDSATAFTFLTAASNSSEVFSGTVGNIVVGTVSATSVDADGGVTVDNITIDGTEIDLSSGDLTIDVAGDLILEAGADVNVPANIGVTFGDDGEKIEGDGTDLTIASSAKINLTATSDIHVPNNVGIVFGGDSEKIEGDGTDLTISANNLTVDAAADIILDAAGNNVTFKSGGTSILDISNSSSDAVITASVQDKDIVFKGDDNGSAITALTLDMSEAGAATFNSTVTSGAGLVIADAGNIGSASDTDAIAIASNGVVTFSQAPVFPDGSIAVADLDIDGATDINAAIVDADLFIVDDGAGGTNRKVAASRLITYVDANANFASTGKAIAMAIVFG